MTDNSLDDLYELADQVIEGLEASGQLTDPYGHTIYSQCGKKPAWPLWARHPFADLWRHL